MNPPRNILMIQAYSAGIGDLLRSSAGWRALHNQFPGARLHLWFLTKEPGYPSEQLMARHPLLASFHVSDKRTKSWRDWQRLLREAKAVAQQTQPDLILDFEPNGLRTPLLTFCLARWTHAASVGIAKVPLRRLFYRRSAPGPKKYAAARGKTLPLEFCERDFVLLAALGIERAGTPIELSETEEGRAFRETLTRELGEGPPLLGVNLGCGTADAGDRRPDLDLVAQVIQTLHQRHGFRVVLTGAPFEREINRQLRQKLPASLPVVDLAGRTSLLQSVGAIRACRLFLSSDSGPYHLSVAQRVPTLALFNYDHPVAYHPHDWVRCVVAPDATHAAEVVRAAESLLAGQPQENSGPDRLLEQP